MGAPPIILNNLSFHLENTDVSFHNLSLSFGDLKYGIIGDNGVGKTTFLKLLKGELSPTQGSIQRNGIINLVPQSHTQYSQSATIRDILGVTDVLAALRRINNNAYEEKDFDCVSDNWDIENRIEKALLAFSLWPIKFNAPFSKLSGGQKTKLLLAKTQIFPADFILFDEPTNNLDKLSRDILYQYIETCSVGIIIVSHDRELLNRMDQIIEITAKKINLFGGNYNLYCEQKDLIFRAQQKDYREAKQFIKHTERSSQNSREKHNQRQSKGKQRRKSGSQSKIILDNMKSRSQKTQEKMSTKEERIIKNANDKLNQAREKIEITHDIDASLDATNVPNGKIVLEIENVCFKYPNNSRVLINDFNLKITGPNRVALIGPNGCGKSTLIKLIRNQLQPLIGKINVRVDSIAYLDQEVSFLDMKLNLIDNFIALNPGSQTFDAYSALAAFKFRNKDAEKQVKTLSGGEKIRAGLAVSLMSKHPPQLIILDEPTNHLDLKSIKAIENAFKVYQGAILAVSHDQSFLDNISIKQYVSLNIPVTNAHVSKET